MDNTRIRVTSSYPVIADPQGTDLIPIITDRPEGKDNHNITFDTLSEFAPAGAEGPQGEPGNEGKSAYQVWLDEGNVGTEEDFFDSLKGAQGEPGPEGPPGEALVTSVQGRIGAVIIDKTDVGLSNVDNTSDANKPVSTAQAAADALKLNIADIRTTLTGTGLPNGAVTAPVGSIYVDTAVTSGASAWVKKIGTDNMGWSILEGDTGWRNVGSLLLNSWTATQVRLRRINNQVFWGFEALSPSAMTNTSFCTVPTGFQFVGATYSDRQFLTTAANPAAVWRATIGHLGSQLQMQGVTTGTATLYGVLNSTTTQDWPSTLPGTAL